MLVNIFRLHLQSHLGCFCHLLIVDESVATRVYCTSNVEADISKWGPSLGCTGVDRAAQSHSYECKSMQYRPCAQAYYREVQHSVSQHRLLFALDGLQLLLHEAGLIFPHDCSFAK